MAVETLEAGNMKWIRRNGLNSRTSEATQFRGLECVRLRACMRVRRGVQGRESRERHKVPCHENLYRVHTQHVYNKHQNHKRRTMFG